MNKHEQYLFIDCWLLEFPQPSLKTNAELFHSVFCETQDCCEKIFLCNMKICCFH